MDISTIVNHLDTATVLAALGGAGVVGLASQLIKKVLGLESTKVIQFLVISLGFAVAGLQYILSAHNLPPTILGLHTAVLVGVAQPLYVYVIRPLDSFLTKVQAYNASQPAPTSPGGGLPASTLPNPGTTPTNSETTPSEANF